MERVLAAALARHTGSRVTLAGWVHRQRALSQVTFLILRDRSGLAQVVLTDTNRPVFVPETVVAVTGQVVASAQAPGGAELVDATFEVLSEPAQASPIELWKPRLPDGLPRLLDWAPVALRHLRQRAVFALTSACVAGFRATLSDQGFTEIQTPKLVGSATESGANVFALDYFGRPAYLAQSPQLYKQAVVGVFERVFETGPVFRAEPHDTPRHLSEYVSLDAELGFIDDHRDVMAIARDAIAGMVAAAAACPARDVLDLTLPDVPASIPAIDFAAALELVGAAADEPDLAPAHERALGEWALAEHGSEFVYVTGYPMVKRPFYTHPDPARPHASNSFDLLFRGLELITGGQRLHRYEDCLAALTARGQDPADYAGYLQAFKYGMPPHGGFAIGLERFVARLTGAANIRETTLFPRDLNRLEP